MIFETNDTPSVLLDEKRILLNTLYITSIVEIYFYLNLSIIYVICCVNRTKIIDCTINYIKLYY